MLTLIGLGLWNEQDITHAGMSAIKNADLLFFENYTSFWERTPEELSSITRKKILPAERELVEQHAEEKLILPAKEKNVVLLIPGDPLLATTHIDLLNRCRTHNVQAAVIHNASVVNAISRTGLQPYKFGKIASIPFSQGEYEPDSPYTTLLDNYHNNAHTLFLLDLRPREKKWMSVADGLRILQRLEIRNGKGLLKDSSFVVGCARLGSDTQEIVVGTLKKVLHHDFGLPPHCIIIPQKLHFVEEEFLERFRK